MFDKNKIINFTLIISFMFGVLAGIIAVIFNIFMKVGKNWEVAVITVVSAMLALLIIIFIIKNFLKKIFNKNAIFTQNFDNKNNPFTFK